MRTLVIVESPAKAKTLGRFLGPGYTVRASLGHVRDLPQKELGVDIEHRFKPTYHQVAKKRATISGLRAALAEADRLILATDPDREGEAIAWHLVQVLSPRIPVQRVTFHEITEPAVRAAFAHPRTLDLALVNAQQARRVLDRLVGYQISPLLWRTVGGKSAGRVQSVAVRLVVDRELEIRNFVPEEYWTLHADLARVGLPAEHFLARLTHIGKKKAELKTQTDADATVAALKGARYTVAQIKHEQKERRPWPPFTTSTLQQGASARLRLAPAETMKLAQQLYEGVALDTGKAVGLITYMRTDSTAISPEAQSAARAFIAETYGDTYLPARAPHYATRVKNAQEAHEAIRPTDVRRTPESLKPHLDRRLWQLYDLIWRRFVASQMRPALYAVTTVDVHATRAEMLPHIFRAIGRTLTFDGFLRVLDEPEEKKPQARADEEGQDDAQALPTLTENEPLDLLKLLPRQHFTKPPPRYTEAALIKALEERGIGRPSTYAQIMATIKAREYVALDERRLIPTELGEAVCAALVETFPSVMDYAFTAQVEDRLDDIANGERDWVAVLDDWYQPFAEALTDAKDVLKGHTRPQAARAPRTGGGEKRTSAPATPTGADCPECGKPLVQRASRYGAFVGCSGYPQCRYIARDGVAAGASSAPAADPAAPAEAPRRTRRNKRAPTDETPKRTRRKRSADEAAAPTRKRGTTRKRGAPAAPFPEEHPMTQTDPTSTAAPAQTCPQCGKPLVQKSGRYGPFMGCSGYPDCRYILKDGTLPPRGASTTPADASAPAARGAPPTAAGSAGSAPAAQTCPQCGKPLVQKSGRYGPFMGCSGYPDCRYILKDGALPPRGATPAGPTPAAPERARTGATSAPEGTGQTCPQCGKPLVQKSGRYGPFMGCSGYPDCRYILKDGALPPRGASTGGAPSTGRASAAPRRSAPPPEAPPDDFGFFDDLPAPPEAPPDDFDDIPF